jgi:hypothetical protein
MDKIIYNNDLRIALIVDAVYEAFICIDTAMRFAGNFMDDKDEEGQYKVEVELPKAKEWIERAIKNTEFLKKELENQ